MPDMIVSDKPETVAPPRPGQLQIVTVPGFFVHDDPEADPSTYHYDRPTPGGGVLGLLNRPYDIDTNGVYKTQWQKFEIWLNETNQNSSPNVTYKLIYMGRHGQGEHNVAEAKYGTIKWDVSNYKVKLFLGPY